MGTKIDEYKKHLLDIMDSMPDDTCGDWRDSLAYAIETMRKYQMIKQLVNQTEYAGENSYTGETEWILTDSVYQKIWEILEDGNDD